MMITEDIKELLREKIKNAENPVAYVNELKMLINECLDILKGQPVNCVKWIPVGKVTANDYNPNSVPRNELHLLYISVMQDGFTQPVVTIYDSDNDKYVIVDGFHRYSLVRNNKEVSAMTNGLVPIVVIDKGINDRMASTIRHNRARGKHAITGMANIVFNMLDHGWSDETICRELGMEPDELVRLKYVTGFAKLFENVEYQKAWETRRQIMLRKEYMEKERRNGNENL